MQHIPPAISLNLQDFPIADRTDIWRDFTSGLFDFRKDAIPDQQFCADVCAYRLGPAVLGRYQHSANRIRRNKNTRSDMEQDELLVLRMHLAGETAMQFEGNYLTLGSGNIGIYDFGQSFDAVHGDVDYISFGVPYAAVNFDPSKHKRSFAISNDTPMGIILHRNLMLLSQLVQTHPAEDATRLAEGFCGLLQATLAQHPSDVMTHPDVAQSLDTAVRHFIEDNLTDPALTVDRICLDLGLGRARLNALFAAEGGVKRFVQMSRLGKAHDELRHSVAANGAVARIARKWGFADQAYFSRRFREEFGSKPTDLLGAALAPVAERPATARNPVPKVPSLAALYGAPQAEAQNR